MIIYLLGLLLVAAFSLLPQRGSDHKVSVKIAAALTVGAIWPLIAAGIALGVVAIVAISTVEAIVKAAR